MDKHNEICNNQYVIPSQLLGLSITHCANFVQKFGPERMVVCAAEECAELIQAVTKMRRNELSGKPTNEKVRNNLIEELAHVNMTIHSLMHNYNITAKEVNEKIIEKINDFYADKINL